MELKTKDDLVNKIILMRPDMQMKQISESFYASKDILSIEESIKNPDFVMHAVKKDICSNSI